MLPENQQNAGAPDNPGEDRMCLRHMANDGPIALECKQFPQCAARPNALADYPPGIPLPDNTGTLVARSSDAVAAIESERGFMRARPGAGALALASA